MQIIADLHMHTNVTAHAYSTLTEMVQAAEGMGLAAIAITNHGPTNPDGPHEWHFSNMDLIPRKIGSVTVIRGIEFDITAPAGGINVMANKSLKPIEFALASFHECLFPPADRQRLPENYLKRINEVAAAHKGALTLAAADRPLPVGFSDGFILIYGGIEMNCTFEAMFAGKQEALQDCAHHILFPAS